MTYLLDANTVSAIIRNPTGPVALRLRAIDQSLVKISILVAAELRFGYSRIGSAKYERLVEGVLASYTIPAWDEPCDRLYADLRTQLERRGQPIGQMDMLIAAHALALDAVLVTDNEREFHRVPGLAWENWIRP